MAPAAISPALLPHISKLDDDEESAFIGGPPFFWITLRVFRGSSFLFSTLIIPIVGLLYSSNYFPTIVQFIIVMPGGIFAQARSVFSTFFSGQGSPRNIA
jgi:O-antigen/teichoic acid export membrane protein